MVLENLGELIENLLFSEEQKIRRIQKHKLENGYVEIDHVELGYLLRLKNLIMPSVKKDNIISVVALNIIKPDSKSVYEVVAWPDFRRNEDLSIRIKGKYIGSFEINEIDYTDGQKKFMNIINRNLIENNTSKNKHEFLLALPEDTNVFYAFKNQKQDL